MQGPDWAGIRAEFSALGHDLTDFRSKIGVRWIAACKNCLHRISIPKTQGVLRIVDHRLKEPCKKRKQ